MKEQLSLWPIYIALLSTGQIKTQTPGLWGTCDNTEKGSWWAEKAEETEKLAAFELSK